VPPRVGHDQQHARDGDGPGRQRPQRPAVQQDGGGHAGAELGQVRQQRGRQRLGPVVRVGEHRAQQAAGDDQERERELPSAVRAEPQREQAGERERRVERHLDRQGPHRWIEVLDRLEEVVLGEEQEDRQLGRVDLHRVVEVAQQQERDAEREPVAGEDPGGAADRVAHEAGAVAHAVERRADERAEEQEAREHEEQLDAEAQLAEREVQEALRRPVAVAVAEHPHVQDQDAGGGEAAQAVERVESTTRGAGAGRLGRGHVQTVGHEAERRRRTLRAGAERRSGSCAPPGDTPYPATPRVHPSPSI